MASTDDFHDFLEARMGDELIPPSPAPTAQQLDRDIMFIVSGTRVVASRLLLIGRSPYFAQLLSGFAEAEIEIRDAPPAVFSLVLQYLETNKIELTLQNVWPVRRQAQLYQLFELEQLCSNFIYGLINTQNAGQLYVLALEGMLHS
jgi:hypothetical protein